MDFMKELQQLSGGGSSSGGGGLSELLSLL